MARKKISARERLIVAIDETELRPALALARKLRGVVKTLKIGSILFTAYGPDIIKRVRAMGFDIMLDLKFHDIPSTVALSCRSAVRHRVSLMTVHAQGGAAMLESAVRAVKAEARRLRVRAPMIVGVTVLTSVAAKDSKKLRRDILRIADVAVTSGCSGLVCSAKEAPFLRKRFGDSLRLICPGIRPAGRKAHDQVRTCTPPEAIKLGADYLVVGRPITESKDPKSAAQHVLDSIAKL